MGMPARGLRADVTDTARGCLTPEFSVSGVRTSRAGKGRTLPMTKRLRVIAESNYKSDDIDVELLARMRLAGLKGHIRACRREPRRDRASPRPRSARHAAYRCSNPHFLVQGD